MALGNAILRFQIRIFGLAAFKKRLKRIDKRIKGNFNPLARRIVIQLLKEADKPMAASARGRPPVTWKRHAVITAFIRMRRARAKNKDPKILVDKGLLRASNLPFIRSRGRVFGIENRLPYASLQHFGGKSRTNTVRIGGFKRKSKSGGTHRVRPYSMTIRGGKTVPPRPWMPTRKRVLQILRIILDDFQKKLGK